MAKTKLMRRALLATFGLLLWPLAVRADVDYVKQVKPILKQRCFACHGALKQKAGLRLDSGSLILKGGESGGAIVAGKPAESLILERVTAGEGERMPPEGAPLTPEQIAILKQWIEAGAKFPETDAPESDPREHWAFRPPVRPAVPDAGKAWQRNAIDGFLARAHEQHGLIPNPEADRATLLRRVTYDLTGLPPSRQELRAFLADGSSDAYERVVDRLLDSPQYGERWARHWMDVWRYSDWYGRRSVPDVMNSYPMIWRWRDWIIRSLNDDRGYDWMVARMLAADEIDPESDADVVATGFIVRNWFKWNYNSWMRDQVEHTGKAFLGLTFNCCHCHDHKYDPISQEDYFRFRAFFEPLELRHDRVAGEPDPGPFEKYVYAKAYGPIKSGLIRVFDEKLDAPTFLYEKGDERKKVEGRPPILPGMPAALGGSVNVQPVSLPPKSFYPGLKPFVQREELAKVRAELSASETAIAPLRTAWESQKAPLEAEVAMRERELQTAMTQAAGRAKLSSDPRRKALAGTQSLLLDAAQGRRLLGHKLAGLNGLDEGGTISFLVSILKDEHFNFQLGLDIDAGLTGAFVTFEKGKIQTYPPGTYNVTQVGTYDLPAGQDRFQLTFRREGTAGLWRLTVKSLSDGKLLVDNVPSESHNWQPVADGKRGIFVDARPGTVALLDDLVFAQPNGQAVLTFDFEPPVFADAKEIAGTQGWLNTTFSVPPASSLVVSSVSNDPAVIQASGALRLAQAKRDRSRLALSAAEAKVAASKASLEWVESRIAADLSRYSPEAAAKQASPALIQAAIRAEQQASILSAKSQLAAAEHSAAVAEVPPTGDAAKDAAAKAARDKAQQAVAAARTTLATLEAALSKAPADYTAFTPRYPATSTGRRKALAEWIVRRDNPLTARVAVNHLWGWHFGQPLVDTTFNFGRSGKPPSHPELLDWLAVELMDSGWRMKPLHRLIVTSAAYRLRSDLAEAAPANLAADRDNRLLWRFNPSRLEAELVRDGLLMAAGELDARVGGPELDQSLGLTAFRRSLYFSHHGEERMKFLELFDAADPTDCYERTSSVTPQQALALSNSELTHLLSRKLAARLWNQTVHETPDAAVQERAFVENAFEQALNRPATAAEIELSRRFLQKQSGNPAKAREGLVQALLNHNDFVTVR